MPWNIKDYPADWDTIRAVVLARAGACCEGSPAYPDCRAPNHLPHPVTGSRVVLTTAHLCRCRPKCGEVAHLWIDHALHVQHAAETRRLAKEALGQVPFSFMIVAP